MFIWCPLHSDSDYAKKIRVAKNVSPQNSTKVKAFFSALQGHTTKWLPNFFQFELLSQEKETLERKNKASLNSPIICLLICSVAS